MRSKAAMQLHVAQGIQPRTRKSRPKQWGSMGGCCRARCSCRMTMDGDEHEDGVLWVQCLGPLQDGARVVMDSGMTMQQLMQ